MTAPLLELDGVACQRGTGGARILDGVSLSVLPGARTAVLGVNGAGKTSLFYTLAGVYRPCAGTVRFRGAPLDYSREGLAALHAETAVVLQNPDDQIFASTVEEDVAFGPLNLGLPRDEVERRIVEALAAVGMEAYRSRPVQQLSYGQRKRVALAGALAVRPRVLLLDEPTAGLDPQGAADVMELAELLHLAGTAILLATHDIDLVYAWADDAVVLRGGRAVYRGPTDGLFADESLVELSGLRRPAVFSLNLDAARLRRANPAPYPRTAGEFLCKHRAPAAPAGRLVTVPVTGELAAESFAAALASAGPGVRVGVYGPAARREIQRLAARTDFFFGALDACVTEAVLGRPAVLVHDAAAGPTVAAACARLADFGLTLIPEVLP